MGRRIYFFPPPAGAPVTLQAPANASATPLGSDPKAVLRVLADYVAGATGYRLYTAATSAGPYTALGAALAMPAYDYAGRAAGTTYWFKWQALGNGTTYLDSALSAAFSGSTQVAAPVITGFSPTSGGVGTAVTLTGTNFATASGVRFGSIAAMFTVLSDATINTTVPAGATTATLSVTTTGGTATSSQPFTVTTAPVVQRYYASHGINSLSYDAGANLMRKSGALYLGTGTSQQQPDPQFSLPDTLGYQLAKLADSGNEFTCTGVYGQDANQVANLSSADYNQRYKTLGYTQYPSLTVRHFLLEDTVNTFNRYYYEQSNTYTNQDIASLMLADYQAVRARALSTDGGFTHFSICTGSSILDENSADHTSRYTATIDLLQPLLASAFAAEEIIDTWTQNRYLGKGGHQVKNAFQPFVVEGVWRDLYHKRPYGALCEISWYTSKIAARFGQSLPSDLTTATAAVSNDKDVLASVDSIQSCEFRLHNVTYDRYTAWQCWPQFHDMSPANYVLEARVLFGTAVVTSAQFLVGTLEEPETQLAYVDNVEGNGGTVTLTQRKGVNAVIKTTKAQGTFGSLQAYLLAGMPSDTGGVYLIGAGGHALYAGLGSQGEADPNGSAIGASAFTYDATADGGYGACQGIVLTRHYSTAVSVANAVYLLRGKYPKPAYFRGLLQTRTRAVGAPGYGTSAGLGFYLDGNDTLIANGRTAAYGAIINDGDYHSYYIPQNPANNSVGSVDGQNLDVAPSDSSINELRIGWDYGVGSSGTDSLVTDAAFFAGTGTLPTAADFAAIRAAVLAVK